MASSPDNRSTGSGRKQLPSVPDSGEMPVMFSTPKSPDSQALKPRGPLFIEYSLMAEYKQLEKQKLPGVYVIPSANTPLCWNGVLFIRQGFYQGGVFKFILDIPDNYPDGDCPKLIFEHPVFHPLVDPGTGELDVKRTFQKWRRNVNHLWQVLLYARRVFYKIDTKTPLNPEAAIMYEEDLELYKSRVAETVQECKDKLYDPPTSDDPHAIRFSPFDANVHDEAKNQMLAPKKESVGESPKNAHASGLSWMSQESINIVSPTSPPSPLWKS